MESLKNVLVKDESFYERKRQSVDEILSFQEVRNLLNYHNLNRNFVENHWIDFLNYVDDLKNCLNCTGIEDCKKNFVGYQRHLEIEDGNALSSFVVCPFGKKIEETRRIMSHIDANIPKDIFLVSFQDLELNNQGNLVLLIKHLLEDLKQPSTKGLYLHGDMGTGKTYVLAAFCHMLALQDKACAFISVPQLLQDLKSYFNSGQDNGLEDLKEVDYLVLDDIGAETLSVWGRDEVLYNLLNDRMLRKKPTYFTSVYSLVELEKHYRMKDSKEEIIKVKRLMERINALSEQFELIGKSFR